MSLSQFSVGAHALAQIRTESAPTKTPPKRRTVAKSDSTAVPEAR